MDFVIRHALIRAVGLGLLMLAGSLALAAPPAMAQNRVAQGNDVVDVIFKEIERQIIREYFGKETDVAARGRGGKKKAKGGKGGGLPPGLAKRERLPPGLQRQLVKNGTLPPGISKRALPLGLNSRLGPIPAGTERVIVGGDIALVEIATGVILDILKDVLSD